MHSNISRLALALRALICIAFVYALTHPNLPQIDDPATRARMIAWPVGLLLVPLILRLASKDRPYPWRADALLALPFALDSVGNSFNLYHSWQSYDTINHCVSWFGLAMLASLAPQLRGADPFVRAFTTLGAGAVGSILWELGEYAAFIHKTDYTSYAYTDTLTDLLSALIGATVAAIVVFARSQGWRANNADPASTSKSADDPERLGRPT